MKEKYNKENLKAAVDKSTSIREVSRNLEMCETGGNFYTIKKYIALHNIDTSHFLTKEESLVVLHKSNKIPDEEVFTINSTYNNTTSIKKRILKNNMLPYECSCCKNNGIWQGSPITLQLDHINGVNDDNRIENLRFLCPNCHSQTDTFSGKHKGKKFLKNQQRVANGGRTNKQIESSENRRVVERPSKETLLNNITDLGFKGTGRVYNVTDNTIRKWCKIYKMSTSIKDYK